jgi:hypothetical protein
MGMQPVPGDFPFATPAASAIPTEQIKAVRLDRLNSCPSFPTLVMKRSLRKPRVQASRQFCLLMFIK